MSAYDLETVLKKWGTGELTTEQAIGQILLLLTSLNNRIGALEKRQEQTQRRNYIVT